MAEHLSMVDFSFAAAAAASETCRRVAGRLDDVLGARADEAARLAEVWQGRLHDEVFAATGLALQREGTGLHEELLAAAAAIDRAAEDARAENSRRREVNRQRDLAEHRERARREAQQQGPR